MSSKADYGAVRRSAAGALRGPFPADLWLFYSYMVSDVIFLLDILVILGILLASRENSCVPNASVLDL